VNLRQTIDVEQILAVGLQQADWVKLNDDELETVCQLRKLRFNTAQSLYASLLREHTLVIVTLGEQGSLVFGGSNRAVPIHEPGVPAKVIDTVGAGDAFTAAMVCLHLEGLPLRECARFANHYAARVCEHVGATPKIDRAEVERAAGLSP
jgi:fructokinase